MLNQSYLVFVNEQLEIVHGVVNFGFTMLI